MHHPTYIDLILEQNAKNKPLIIIASAGGLILIAALGGADASLLQLFALDVMGLQEKEIGLVIGISSVAFPMQFMGIWFLKRWGAKQVSKVGFALLFLILPTLLIAPLWQRQDAFYGYAFFCLVILVMNIVHSVANGVSWQSLIRESTAPAERGWFFASMRLVINITSLLFFGGLVMIVGNHVSLQDYSWIIAFLMAYCLTGFIATSKIKVLHTKAIAPSISASSFLNGLKKIFHNRSYTTLIIIMVLSSLPSLPLLVTYVSTRLHFQADQVSQLISINIVGTVLGLIIWGRQIDQSGFKKVLRLILLLLTCVGPLWLFVHLTPNHEHMGFLTIAVISFLTTFLYSGLKISLIVGVHNTITEDAAMVSLAFFNMILGLFFSVLAVLMSLYLQFTGTWNMVVDGLVLDSYQFIALIGAMLCGICLIFHRRILPGS